MTIEELITSNYSSLNPNDQLISKFILNNKHILPELSINEMAENCLVSRSTIMRYAQKLGLKGFAELKMIIKLDNQSVPPINDKIVELVCENNVNTIQHFKKLDMTSICKSLYHSNRIYVYGTGSIQQSLAKELKRMFLSIGIIIDIISGKGELAQTTRIISSKDCLIIISKDGESVSLLEQVRTAKMKGSQIISLTRSRSNSLSRESNENIAVAIERHHIIDDYFFDSMTMMFIVIEILFAKYLEFIKQQINLE